MKIKIRDETHKLSFWIPTSTIKYKWIWNLMNKKDTSNKFDYTILKEITPKIYKALRKYVRTNGHFVLLEAISEKDSVKIII